MQKINPEVVGTGKGLSLTTDQGQSWKNFSRAEGLGKGAVTAIAERKGEIWVATGFDTTTELGSFDAGGGLSWSADSGNTWHWIAQPRDRQAVIDSFHIIYDEAPFHIRGDWKRYEDLDFKPTTTNILNLTYDIAMTDSAVWITSFGGGLRKTTDQGKTWKVVTVDGYPFDALGHLSHRVFSVIYTEKTLWVGSAGGIHKSTNGGKTWTTFNHQNQEESISGNFVVAIGYQQHEEREILWASTIETTSESEDYSEYRGVSKTEDGGLSWTVVLAGEFAHNFGFERNGPAVYIATDNGIFKSLDYGETWAVFPYIVDSEDGEAVYTTEMTSVGSFSQDTLWIGSLDGLARTFNQGLDWKVFRTFQIPGQNGNPETYAYPNPFSPMQQNLRDGDGFVRFQYRTSGATQVTIKIFDFGMNLVRYLVERKSRSFSGDYAEVWDGRNDLGDLVANGTYFYQITMDGKDPLWGKVMVVN